jgi:hypothetical protein
MQLDLSHEETAALLQGLSSLIDGDKYFPSPRVQAWKRIRAKIKPEPVPEPRPPPRQYEPPR